MGDEICRYRFGAASRTLISTDFSLHLSQDKFSLAITYPGALLPPEIAGKFSIGDFSKVAIRDPTTSRWRC